MPVYTVVVTDKPEAVAARIEATIHEQNRLRLAHNAWLLDYDGTTQALVEDIGIRTKDVVGSGIAFPVTNYSGRSVTNTWEWLKLHLSRAGS